MGRAHAVIMAVLLSGTGAGCHGSPGPRDPARQPAVSVTTAEASLVERPERLEAGGTVAAQTSAVLASRILAPVAAMSVRAGDRVRKGAVLVALDAKDAAERAGQAAAAAQAADRGLVLARTQQDAAEADHRLAGAWQARIGTLYERDSATAQERDEAEARLAAAAARLAAARAGIEQADANLGAARSAAAAAAMVESFAVIRAPFDGVVTERLTDPGNLAAPGTPLLRLESSGARQVEARVDEARAGFINPGDLVEVFVDGRSDAEPEAEAALEGRVIEVARAVAADQRAFTVKVAVPGLEHVRTGSFARVRFGGPRRSVLLIPAAAVRRSGQVSSVFVVEGGVARLRLVQLGDDGPEGTTVLAGLEPGETVVTAPPPELVDGRPVATGRAVPRPGGGS